jgi:hypothetical protein
VNACVLVAEPPSASTVTVPAQMPSGTANRAVPGELELHITGDRGRAAAVLAAVPALALD